ncbi:substrate-binding domain of hmg-CoA reductase [Aspergillus brunneoviolaceus CBS 621.78]|uniref:Substrate-binding domain of hmg-CoA reductase n=1 Tax=Aspergillus brunneoviolaceus CBS 621.78 TaxID=1450534 RepID=A0ACD1GG94_9EURO|nr:substrate-binding domain of hmg-CoA reductase [Aspergillus brunneoviolaceus CBS 621.78]RAH48309.1 substrate-binding domain of hmg-CoA reductase [Aspergillus brunneoviolaceus CBS 621.78]
MTCQYSSSHLSESKNNGIGDCRAQSDWVLGLVVGHACRRPIHTLLVTALVPEGAFEAANTSFPVEKSPPFISSRSVQAEPISPTSNLFTSFFDEFSLVYQVPYSHLSMFLGDIQVVASGDEDITWAIQRPRGEGKPLSLGGWAQHAEIVDVVIIRLGYLALNMTVVSLFRAMRHLGSRVWLASSVILSGAFAFVLGLVVTTACGVPIDVRLLSEGLPFLVLTMGFENPYDSPGLSREPQQNNQLSSIPTTMQTAINAQGWSIVRSYLLEIRALALGAALRSHDRFGQCCFLAAWTLVFDAVLLLTFYATVLCIKLEITRVRFPDTYHQADERCGPHIFGYKVKPANVARRKLIMVGGFVLVNMLQLLLFVPFKMAANGLNDIYLAARAAGTERRVTVLPPIRYTLHASSSTTKPVDGVFIEIESPVARLCLIGILVVSLILNSHLMHAARWHAADAPNAPEETEALLKSDQAESLTDEELATLCLRGKIAGYSLEKTLENIAPGSSRLEAFTLANIGDSLLPYCDYNYKLMHGTYYMNMIGYPSLPLGLTEPLLINRQMYLILITIIEDILVASASCDCKTINIINSAVTLLKYNSIIQNLYLRSFISYWIKFLTGYITRIYSYIWLWTTIGNTININIVSKKIERMLRGKSVIIATIISICTVRKILKIKVNISIKLNTAKNLINSIIAGSIGRFNIYNPAQNSKISSCNTAMKNINSNLHIAVFMFLMKVGIIGGGIIVEMQGAMLDLLEMRGVHPTDPGANACCLARIIAAAVLAGDLSTCSALAVGRLVNAHMQYNPSAAASGKKNFEDGGRH